MDRFIRCLVDSDLSALVIAGNPSLQDTAEAWANIYAEYLDLNADNETTYLLQLQKEISLLVDTITEVDTALLFLTQALLPNMVCAFRPELVEIIHAQEFDYPFDLTNPDEYMQSIEAVNNQLSPLRLRLETFQKELSDYVSNRADQTVDTAYFDKTLVRLSRFYRMMIRAREITVKEFVLMMKDYMDYLKPQQRSLEPDGNEG